MHSCANVNSTAMCYGCRVTGPPCTGRLTPVHVMQVCVLRWGLANGGRLCARKGGASPGVDKGQQPLPHSSLRLEASVSPLTPP